MSAQQVIPDNDQLIGAYHLTLTGVDDDAVREELRRLCQYETSDDLTFRISHAELMRMRTAMAQRLGEERAHPAGALWIERHVYAHEPTDANGFFDETTRDV